jgi:hypothetical protein
MLRLGQGKVDEAWEDLLSCHRLSRLCGQDPTLVGALVSIAVDGVASKGDAAVIEHGNLSLAQARRMMDQFQSLDPLPSMAEKIDIGERFMYADVVCCLARGDTGALEMTGGGASSVVGKALKSAAGVMIDWDLILRRGNAWYDRMVQTARIPTYAQRVRAEEALDEEIQAVARDIKDPWKVAGSFLLGKSPRRVASESISNVLAALLLPAVNAACKVEDRQKTQEHLTVIGFALAAYRAENGAYPERLADLAPQTIAQVPVDLYTGQAFRYQRQGDGFLMYSLGPNRADNGGKVDFLDREKAAPGEDTSEWDDYRLRIPVLGD